MTAGVLWRRIRRWQGARHAHSVPVHLHLGAHKTGTTFLQNTLEINRPVLVEYGVAYPPHSDMREPLRRAVHDRDYADARTMIGRVSSGVPECRLIVVSEENISAHCSHMAATGRLYPRIKKQVGRGLSGLLGSHSVTIFYCLRSYDTFLPALYCEAIRLRPFESFEEFIQRFDLKRLSWCAPVGALVDLVGEENIVLWDFADFVANPLRIAARIADVPFGSVHLHDVPQRSSPSEAAIAALERMRTSLPDTEITKHVKAMEIAYPRSQHPAFQPFSPALGKELAERYAADWASIRRDFPHATFL